MDPPTLAQVRPGVARDLCARFGPGRYAVGVHLQLFCARRWIVSATSFPSRSLMTAYVVPVNLLNSIRTSGRCRVFLFRSAMVHAICRCEEANMPEHATVHKRAHAGADKKY